MAYREMPDLQRDLPRVVLGVLFIAALVVASLWILRPFLGALIWSVMIVIPTWPLMISLERHLGRRRSLAVAVMSLMLLLILIGPLLAGIGAVILNADDIVAWIRRLPEIQLPPPPAWLAGLPLVGERLAGAWRQAATQGLQPLVVNLAPSAGNLVQWFVGKIGNVGALLVNFLLTVIGTALLYSNGEKAADMMLRFGARLAGEPGVAAVRLSARAIRGVALGVVATALAQTMIGWVGLALTGVPFALVLTVLIFVLALAQIGGAPVLIVGVVWLFWHGFNGAGTFLGVITLITAVVDNVVRPVLIKKGADLPLLLIFAGVIGGLIAFGLIGIFVGPVVLAICYTLLHAWLESRAQGTTMSSIAV